MNYKMIGKILALILAACAVFMLPALFISMADAQTQAVQGFLFAFLVTGAVALVLWLFSRGATKDFFAGEGMVCVGLGWILMSLFGSLPFLISGEIPRFIDALFEIVSGFTTTGASILTDVEALSRGMLYWRSFSHWIGGMGVLVFVLAVAPVSPKNEGFTMHLLRAESPGPSVGKLVPRMRKTVLVLYLTYIVLTIVNFLFLLVDLSPFEALMTAFGTAGTGGFGIRNSSMMAYTPYTQVVTTVFMLLFSINFTCYYLLLLGRIKDVLKDEELRLFFAVVVASIALVTLDLCTSAPTLFSSFGENLRHASFQVSSFVSTTGFVSANYDLWPAFSKAILFFLMCMGACAGSTGGGFKAVRVLILIKVLFRNINQALHPKRVKVIRINGKAANEKLLSGTTAYLVLYLAVFLVSFFLISLDGESMMSNISSVMACLNNTGPGFEAVGAVSNYAGFSVLSKGVLIFDMLAGRLELFPILMLFRPASWRRD
ncbi:MAG: TrkH family potassium uptake protein [Clostridia bacterium]|nr:TrkH family potassium uptake protein [Clostridia bacterium]